MSDLILALNFAGPMQSWGASSRFNRRETDLMPTRSAVAGLCCAAMGIDRGREEAFLSKFSELKMVSFFVPRKIYGQCDSVEKPERVLQLKRYWDFHTVLGTVTAEGKVNSNAVVTQRQYLSDVSFVVLLEGDREFIEKLAGALRDPIWGIWLGRKTCIPSEPVFAGIYKDRESAVNSLTQGCWSVKMEEKESFSEADRKRDDVPLSFSSESRAFGSRFVKLTRRI